MESKQQEYTVKILNQLDSLFEEGNENKIEITELEDNGNASDFFHALANLPAVVYAKLTEKTQAVLILTILPTGCASRMPIYQLNPRGRMVSRMVDLLPRIKLQEFINNMSIYSPLGGMKGYQNFNKSCNTK